MAKNAITDYSETPILNTDIGGVGIQGTALVSAMDNALRQIMAQLAEVNKGTKPVADTWSFGDPADLTKKYRFDAGLIAAGQTRVIAIPDADGTILTESVAAATYRPKLTANRTYYVRTDGNDANNGLADTAGGAFLTIQKAFDVVSALDCSSYDVTIKVNDGTRSGASTWRGHLGTGTVTLDGNVTTPASCAINTTSTAIALASLTALTVKGFKLQTSGGGDCFYVASSAVLTLGGAINFGSCAGSHLRTAGGSIICYTSSYTISGGAVRHITASLSGSEVDFSGVTVTLTGTPAWSGEFIVASACATIGLFSVTFSGAATGKRYTLSMNAVINSYGAGSASTYFPGNVNGTVISGGVQG